LKSDQLNVQFMLHYVDKLGPHAERNSIRGLRLAIHQIQGGHDACWNTKSYFIWGQGYRSWWLSNI